MKVVMAIGGSDSCAGAGIQADLKAIQMTGNHGVSVITGLTAQSPDEVRLSEPISAKMVSQQFHILWEKMRPSSVKVGALFSIEVVDTICHCIEKSMAGTSSIPWVIDPILKSTSGTKLGGVELLEGLLERCQGTCNLLTPNIPEAETLTNGRISRIKCMKEASKHLFDRFGTNVLLKGGHLTEEKESSVDILYDGSEFYEFSERRISQGETHGTGCTLSSLIAGYLAHGDSLEKSVAKSKEKITHSIRTRYQTGKYWALNTSIN